MTLLGLCTPGEVCWYSCADEPPAGNAGCSGRRGHLPLPDACSLDKVYLL